MLKTEQNLEILFKNWFGTERDEIIQLPNSGSNRTYYRLSKDEKSAIGVFNKNLKENIAFIDFTLQFKKFRINVPEIYSENIKEDVYLISDLGDNQLFKWLESARFDSDFTDKFTDIYKKVIRELVRMQVIAGRNFDYSKCYPYSEFDERAIKFDLNYFKTNYADALKLEYNQNKLNSDFDLFAEFLLMADNNYFMFRDFQSRNIMLVNGDPFFIDYQGGRKGALQYDLVSLLFQAKAQISEDMKLLLLEHYLNVAQLFIPLNRDEFTEYFYAFALIRVLQTLGAYGLRGLVENKNHFIESIPLAISNLVYLLDKVELLNQMPELKQIITQVINGDIKTNEY
ncbi:MAG: phosphotransferase [Bacteroidales bacterium]|nr:phosphotransferase [Bacteroidales bacterium]